MRSFSPKLKKIFTGMLMLVVLANSGFLPIFENGLIGKSNARIAEAQQAVTNTGETNTTKNYEKAKAEAQRESGYYNGQNRGGIYEDAYQTWISQGNTPAEAKAEANRIAQQAYDEILPYTIKQQEAANGGTTKEYEAATKEVGRQVVFIKNNNQILSGDALKAALEKAESDAEIKARQDAVNQTSRDVEANARVQTAIDTAPDQSTEGRAKAAKAERERIASESEANKPNDKGPILCGFSIDTMVGKVGNGGTFEGCIAIGAYIFLKLSAWFLQVVGLLFNVTLNFTLNIGKVIPSGSNDIGPIGLGGSSGAIYVGWSTIRDFINVAFIFVLLYVAISIILQTDKYGLQKLILKVVIAVLLLNFSLFFTKAIIDLSNIVSLQFYSRIMDAAAKAGGNTTSVDGGLSAGLANTLGLQSIWVFGEGVKSQSSLGMNAYDLTLVSIFGGVFLLVFAFVLLMATIQFILRSIVLIFLMITSPVGFLYDAIPGLENTSKEWWSRLKNNAIFAPAYMAVMYISCLMIFGPARSGIAGNGNIAQLITGHTKYQYIGIVVWFVFVIGFLIAAQVSARKFADGFGSSYSGKIEGWLKGRPKWFGGKALSLSGKAAAGAGGLAAGAASIAARKTILNGVGRGLLTKTPLKNLGGQKLFEKLAAKQVEVAKEKSKNLRRRSGEGDTDYALRQNRIVNKAKDTQAKAFGLDPTLHFDTDAKGNKTLNAAGKARIEQLKTDAQTRVTRFRRKRDNAAAERASDAYTGPKKGSEDDVKAANKKMETDLAAMKDNVYESLAARYKAEVDIQNTATEQALATGNAAAIATAAAALKMAKKRLAEHTNPVTSLENKLAESREKLEKIKEQAKAKEKEKEKKDAEKKK